MVPLRLRSKKVPSGWKKTTITDWSNRSLNKAMELSYWPNLLVPSPSPPTVTTYMSWSSVIPVQLGGSAPQADLHYMASIRYPILAHPLAVDRIAMLLNKAREATPRMNFQWVKLQTPKNGECFLMVRVDDGPTPHDGYSWHSSKDVYTKTVLGLEMELCKYVTTEASAQPPMAKLEYRITAPKNRLLFIHYINTASLASIKDLMAASSSPEVSRPPTGPISNTPNSKPPMSAAQMHQSFRPRLTGSQPYQRPVAVKAQPGRRIVTATQASALPNPPRHPQQALEDLTELINDSWLDSVDQVGMASLRMVCRSAILCKWTGTSQPTDTKSEEEHVIAGRIDIARRELLEEEAQLQDVQSKLANQREIFRRGLDSIQDLTQPSLNFKDFFSECLESLGLPSVKAVPTVSKSK